MYKELCVCGRTAGGEQWSIEWIPLRYLLFARFRVPRFRGFRFRLGFEAVGREQSSLDVWETPTSDPEANGTI